MAATGAQAATGPAVTMVEADTAVAGIAVAVAVTPVVVTPVAVTATEALEVTRSSNVAASTLARLV
jgi:hypothetical protein